MTPRPSDEKVLELYNDYLRSPRARPILDRMAGRPWRDTILAGLGALTVVGVPFACYHGYRMVTHRGRFRRRTLAAARACKPITTYPLMVNRLLNTVPGSVAPGMVIGSFRPRARQDAEYWLDLAKRLSFFSIEDAKSPDESHAARWLNDETYVESRRLRLPASLTDGCEVDAFHVMIAGDHFPSGMIDQVEIPCVAVPGLIGAIQSIPTWIAEGRPEPA